MIDPRLKRLPGIAALLIIGFAVGLTVAVSAVRSDHPTSLQSAILRLSPAPSGADYNQLLDVWNRVHSEYVNRNVNDQALLQGALSGLVAGLGDPYSSYLTADSAKKFEAEISGTFEGLGMQVGYKNNQVTIIAPLPTSPAERAGIKSGDVILTVDKKDVSAMTLDEVINAIRGQQGTAVTLTIQRGGEPQPRTFSVVREKITVDSVTIKVVEHNGKRLADIAISSFNQDTGRQLRAQAKELGVQNMDGVLLDLRDDPGGYLDQAIDVASVFMPNGLIVAEVDRDGQRKTFNAAGNAFLADKKVVVLVNGGSASASEIVAGALQDSGRGTLVGTQTFGKGSVQDYQTLADGSSLKLTVAKWLTPKGRSISEQGITPDLVVTIPANAKDGEDIQQARALDSLAPAP